MNQEPLVTVITPVYNMGAYIADCIESVLGQTYKNFEYIIVNNRSTDQTLKIALEYAERDKRIRVHTNEKFVPVMENHNIALRLMSSKSKYCKVVCADDFLFPDALAKLVEVAETNPSVGLVGSYQLSGSYIKWQGFAYPKAVFSGREICRRIFLERKPEFGFGTPTSLLYRADLVRSRKEFYPNPSPHSDTSACFQMLQESDFGFVYQVLAYERTHGETQSSKSAQIDRYSSAYLNDLVEYGPIYLSQRERSRLIHDHLNNYHRSLAVSLLEFRNREFWHYHKSRLAELGYPLKPAMLVKGGLLAAVRYIGSPLQAIRKVGQRLLPKWTVLRHAGMGARGK